ncbi:MAG: hypothetical protein AABY22_19810 [Nanoarchaeota archaeon]
MFYNRYVQGIRENWPDYDIYAYLDTENNKNQEVVLRHLYNNWYKSIETIPNKKYKEFWIDSQWGTENQKGFYANVPDLWKSKIENHTLWFNGHIDSLELLEEKRFRWSKYFKIFPKPQINPKNEHGDTIVSNLLSDSSLEHRLQNFYINRMVIEIDRLCQKIGYKHLILSTPKINNLYENSLKSTKNSILINEDLTKVCDIVFNSKLMISIDSGLRPVAWGCDIPVITITKQCVHHGQVMSPQVVRWNPFPELCYPMHYPTNEIVDLSERILENKIYSIFPGIKNWKNELIKRDIIVNLEKSILNN